MTNFWKAVTAAVLSLIFLIAILVYWHNNNACDSVDTLGEKTLAYLKQSVKTKYTEAEGIEQARASLQRNKYAKAAVANSSSFFDKWKKQDTLTVKDTAEYGRLIKEDFDKIVAANHTRKYNQLEGVIIIAGIFILFTFLAFTTNILRDAVGDLKKITNERIHVALEGESPKEIKPSFSLARTQLGVWLTIIGSVYTFALFWDALTPGDINSTALILMGISAGTFAVGAILDTTEIESGIPRSQDDPSSGNFFKDILSDKNGISVHRFQNVVWTVIAIFVYFYRYNNHPAGVIDPLPVLDSTLLALTGISSATYLTLKTRENAKGKNIDIKVKLLPEEGTNQVWAAAFTNSAAILKTASIDLSPIGEGPVLHAVPASSGNPLEFEFAPIEPGKYQNITLKWTGKVPGSPEPDKEVTLTGSNTEHLETSRDISIKYKLIIP